MNDRLKDLIVKNYNLKKLEKQIRLFIKNRKEVDINANGTSGYKIKHGTNKDRVLRHIKPPSKDI